MLKENKNLVIYDFVFAGFGLSAMLLLLEMIKYHSALKSKKILLIDKNQKNTNDKTFSFWTLDPNVLADIPQKKWQKTQLIKKDGQKQVINTKPYFYVTIRSIDFYQYIFSQLPKWENIDFVLDEVIKSYSDGKVQCKNKTYYAKKIIHSAFEVENINPKKPTSYFVWQHFGGWKVKFQKPLLDSLTFTMMDFRTGDNKRNSFFYILPYTEKEALIEYTLFDNQLLNVEDYDNKIITYIQEVLKTKNFEILEKEYGKIPMTTELQLQKNPSKISIGTLAGSIRPATGYSFGRNVEWSKKYAKHILEIENFCTIPFTKKNKMYNNMDKVFLRILHDKLISIENLFYPLFYNNPPKRILNFLTERSTFLELFKIMLSVKRKKLLTSLFIKTFFH